MKHINLPQPVEVTGEDIDALRKNAIVNAKSGSSTNSTVTPMLSDKARQAMMLELREAEHKAAWLRHYLGPNNSKVGITIEEIKTYRKELSGINRLIKLIKRQTIGFDQLTGYVKCNGWEAEGHNKRLRVSSSTPVVIVKDWEFEQFPQWLPAAVTSEVTTAEVNGISAKVCYKCGLKVQPGQLDCSHIKNRKGTTGS